ARDIPRVTVPDGVGAGHELDFAPLEPGVFEGGAGGGDAVLDEAPTPLPPRMHAHAEDGDVVITHWSLPRPASTSRRRTRGRRPRTTWRGRARPRRRPAACTGRRRRRPARARPSSRGGVRRRRRRTARRGRPRRTAPAARSGSSWTTRPGPRAATG